MQNYRHFWTRDWSSPFENDNSHRDRQSRDREMNCRHFVTRVWSSRLKSVNQQSQGSGGSQSQNENCGHFWNHVWSSHLRNLNNDWDRIFELASGPGVSILYNIVNHHRDRGVVVANCKTIVIFELAIGPRVSTLSTVTTIGKLASLYSPLFSLLSSPLLSSPFLSSPLLSSSPPSFLSSLFSLLSSLFSLLSSSLLPSPPSSLLSPLSSLLSPLCSPLLPVFASLLSSLFLSLSSLLRFAIKSKRDDNFALRDHDDPGPTYPDWFARGVTILAWGAGPGGNSWTGEWG